MPTKKNYKFDFFQCETISSQRNNPPLTTGQILEKIKEQFDSLDENTVKNVSGRLLEVRRIDETDYGYRGSIGKYRKTDLPHAAVPGGDEREIELEDDEHLIEKTHFKYFNDYSLLILQRNRYAVSDQALSKYLSINGYATALNPVIEPDDLQRLMRNETYIRAATLNIARPTNPELFVDIEHDFNNSIIASLNSSNSASLNIVMRGDARSGDVEKRYLSSGLKRAFLELKDRFELKAAKILLEENGVEHPLDLVSDRMVYNKALTIEGRYPSSADMWSALMDARNAKEEEIINYFGALDQAQLA